jgi:glutamyl-Q tRNA(Asp) synthetase
VAYVGRFAPSPTGPLHLGSLVAAAASYLHARQAGGRWLVRIEDIDPPREVRGAAESILRTLEAFELGWDGAVLRQSSRLAAYREAAATLLAAGHAFRCRCSRSDLRAAASEGGTLRYPGTCRERRLSASDTAVRARVERGTTIGFIDGLQGERSIDLATTTGDYVIERRDGLPAYHLAVVLDDAFQGVTTVVRGIDLLDSTFVHVHLQRLLGVPTPRYCHLPVVVDECGQKLSKQSGALPVEAPSPTSLREILRLLGLDAPREVTAARPREVWRWALEHWSIDRLRGQTARRAS